MEEKIDNVTYAPSPEPVTPADRNDAVGDIARRLLGTDTEPPDFTAAPLLFDALMGEPDVAMAMSVRLGITNLMGQVGTDEGTMNARERTNRLEHMRNSLYQIIYPCLFDFASICNVLAAHVAECAKKDDVKEGSTTLQTVRVSVPEHARIGHMFPIDETRNGIMVSARGADGKADLVPQDDSDGYAEKGYSHGPMQAMPMGTFPGNRRVGSSMRGMMKRPR